MYDSYKSFINEIISKNDLTGFKSNQDYNVILEHVNMEQGKEYLYYILKLTSISDIEIKAFCNLNDKYGSPKLYDYGDRLGLLSPSSLRYILHAHLILSHIKSIQDLIDIVEIGGGYGGLCLALHYFSNSYNIKINKYIIIDLIEASSLQKLYLSQVCNSIKNIDFIDSETFGSSINSSDLFLISNYCFSEIDISLQSMYMKILFPKVTHGFMVWNYINTYDFGFKYREEVEYPLTGGRYNKYIYF
jgi:hypothetical protein